MLWLGFVPFVVACEEAALEAQLSGEYLIYRANVTRWLPRVTPWRG